MAVALLGCAWHTKPHLLFLSERACQARWGMVQLWFAPPALILQAEEVEAWPGLTAGIKMEADLPMQSNHSPRISTFLY